MSAPHANGKGKTRNKLTKLRDVEAADRNPETAGKSALSLAAPGDAESKAKDKEKRAKEARDAKVLAGVRAAAARDVDGDELMDESEQIALDAKLAAEIAENERRTAELQAKQKQQKQMLERLAERRRRQSQGPGQSSSSSGSPEQSVRFVPSVDVSQVKGADLWRFMADPGITVYGCKLMPMADMFEVIFIDKHKTETLLGPAHAAPAVTSAVTLSSRALAATQALMQSDSVIATVSVPVLATCSASTSTSSCPSVPPSPALPPLAAPKLSDAPKAPTRELPKEPEKTKADKRKRENEDASQLKLERRGRRHPPSMGAATSRPIEVDLDDDGDKENQETKEVSLSPQSPSSRLWAKQADRYQRGE